VPTGHTTPLPLTTWDRDTLRDLRARHAAEAAYLENFALPLRWLLSLPARRTSPPAAQSQSASPLRLALVAQLALSVPVSLAPRLFNGAGFFIGMA
jgi:hypothetical protein